MIRYIYFLEILFNELLRLTMIYHKNNNRRKKFYQSQIKYHFRILLLNKMQ